MSQKNEDENIFDYNARPCSCKFLYHITTVCEEVYGANNIKLATFIALRAAQLKTGFFCDVHYKVR